MVAQEKLEESEMVPMFELNALIRAGCFAVLLAVVVAMSAVTENRVEAFCPDNQQ